MLSAKLATLGLVKVKLFWNKSYDVIIFVHDVTNKSLPHELNEIVDVVGWPMFGNSSSISMRSYHNLSYHKFYKDLTRKTAFFEEWSWFKFNNLGLALGMTLYQDSKRVKVTVRKFLVLIPTSVEITVAKLVGRGRGREEGELFAPLSAIRLRNIFVVNFINIAYVVDLAFMKWLLFSFFGWAHIHPNIVWSCWNFDQRWSIIRQTGFLENSSRFWILAQMKYNQSLQFWTILGPNLPPEN